MAGPFGNSLPVLVFVVGIVVMALEAIVPGGVLVMIGIPLIVAGLAGMAFPPLGTPIGLAVTTLLAGVLTYAGVRQFEIYSDAEGVRTKSADALVGQTGVVTERVTRTDGEVRLDDGGFDPHYRARSFDGHIEVGETVVVTDPGGGNVLTVEASDDPGNAADDPGTVADEHENVTDEQETVADDPGNAADGQESAADEHENVTDGTR